MKVHSSKSFIVDELFHFFTFILFYLIKIKINLRVGYLSHKFPRKIVNHHSVRWIYSFNIFLLVYDQRDICGYLPSFVVFCSHNIKGYLTLINDFKWISFSQLKDNQYLTNVIILCKKFILNSYKFYNKYVCL